MNNQTVNTEETVHIAAPVKNYNKEIAIAIGAGILLVVVVGLLLRNTKGGLAIGDIMAQLES